jgi:hypothetical protein
MDRQIQYTQNSGHKRLEEIYIARDVAEQTSLYSTYKTGISFIDALNGSVRPVLAYSFCILYTSSYKKLVVSLMGGMMM